MLKKLFKYSNILLISLFLFLLADLIFGKYLLETFYWKDKEDFRTEHKIYHHTIKKNYNGNGYFGGKNINFVLMDLVLKVCAKMLAKL